ncbi:hypothetical protein PG984_015323 [Apiospora sp. TS-2023a]
MLSITTSWMQIHVLWLLITLPLIQGSPITSQFLIQPATTTSLSSSSSFPMASPSYRLAISATPTPAYSFSNNTHASSFASSGAASVVTAAPIVPSLHGTGGLLPANISHNINLKFVQTTYWSCVQWPTTVHCGWHEPILDASNGAGSPGRGQEGSRRAAVAGVVAGLIGLLLAAA